MMILLSTDLSFLLLLKSEQEFDLVVLFGWILHFHYHLRFELDLFMLPEKSLIGLAQDAEEELELTESLEDLGSDFFCFMVFGVGIGIG